MGQRTATWRSALVAVACGTLLLLIASDVVQGQANADGATVLDGVFTPQQADRGAGLYNDHCAECHEGADVDGPPLTGGPFIDRWREDALASLLDFMKTQMPQQAPGSLADGDYLAILAHLLRENSFPPGSRELTIRAAQNTLLVGATGPQPLPSGALVEIVGCVARNANQEWVIARASRPARVRSGNEITAAEATAAASVPLGAQTFVLQNIGDAGSALTISGNGGQKVVVKGALTQRGAADRIHVTAAKRLADSCGA